MICYFAYGSNMNGERMTRRCPSARRIGTATLKGWTLVERKYADIERRRGRSVRGVVYALDVRDLLTLDRFEGYPLVYGGCEVWVTLDACKGTRAGERVKAWTYYMTAETRAEREGIPYPAEYAAICAEGASENGLPDAYWRLTERGETFSIYPIDAGR